VKSIAAHTAPTSAEPSVNLVTTLAKQRLKKIQNIRCIKCGKW
jgi:hypothetical protein